MTDKTNIASFVDLLQMKLLRNYKEFYFYGSIVNQSCHQYSHQPPHLIDSTSVFSANLSLTKIITCHLDNKSIPFRKVRWIQIISSYPKDQFLQQENIINGILIAVIRCHKMSHNAIKCHKIFRSNNIMTIRRGHFQRKRMTVVFLP